MLRNRGSLSIAARTGSAGFTLIELLVVIAVIGILCAMLLPVLGRAKAKAQGTLCLSNGKQMVAGLILYSGDNNELFAPNPDDGNTIPGHNWCPGQSGIGGGAEFNPDVLKDSNRSMLLPYIGDNINLFRCPSDRRMGLYQGTNSSLIGQHVPAIRSFAMNQAVGTICPGFDRDGIHDGVPRASVNGPWLDGKHTNRRNAPWMTYGRYSDVRSPSPDKLWIFVDEDPIGLNDAAFAFAMDSPIWRDLPGSYHNGACGFAFADGHCEVRRWRSNPIEDGRVNPLTSTAAKNDWLWMRERTSGHASGTLPDPK